MFVVKIHLNTNQLSQSILSKRFNVSSHFYNAVLREGKKRAKKVWSSPEWQQSGILNKERKYIKEQIEKNVSKKKDLINTKKVLDEKIKDLWNVIREKTLWGDYSLREFGWSVIRKKGTFIEQLTTANECNNLTKRAYDALVKYLFHKSKKVNFISIKNKSRSLTCIKDGGSSSSTFHLDFNSMTFWWKCGKIKLVIPLNINKKDIYHNYVLNNYDAVKEIKLVRKNRTLAAM